ncbi:MAG: autotransporter domain-containing protein [Fusobacteriaceae bacterium]
MRFIFKIKLVNMLLVIFYIYGFNLFGETIYIEDDINTKESLVEDNTIFNSGSSNGIIDWRNIENNANISTSIEYKSTNNSVDGNFTGNGIYTSGGIINNGNISTNIEFNGGNNVVTANGEFTDVHANSYIAGNGIYATGNVMNNGNISTNLKLQGGNGAEGYSMNTMGISEKSGNGIYTSGEVINNGNIKTNLEVLAGNGVEALDPNMNNNILAKVVDSGNGIYAGGRVINNGYLATNINARGGDGLNTGVSGGNSSIEVRISKSGNGIYTSGEVLNSGYISTNLTLNGGSNSTNTRVDAGVKGIDSGNGIYTTQNVSNDSYIQTNILAEAGNNELSFMSTSEIQYTGNGIYTSGEVINTGNISTNVKSIGGNDYSNDDSYFFNFSRVLETGNGIYTGESVENTGVISGYVSAEGGVVDGLEDYKENNFSGNGIAFNGTISNATTINNSGVIKGSQSAIAAVEIDGTVNNYGVFAGREIYSDGVELQKNDNASSYIYDDTLGEIKPATENNYGIYVNLAEDLSEGDNVAKDSSGNVIIEEITNGAGGYQVVDGETVYILNADISGTAGTSDYDSYIAVNGTTNSYDTHIINGAGNTTGVLSLNAGSSLDLTNTTVNAYKTAVSLDDNATLNATDTVFNGGGLTGDDAVILSTGDNTSVNIKGDSIVNGDILVEGNDSDVAIDNSVKINGDILAESGSTNNSLQLGTGTSGELVIFGEINNFSNIDVKGDVTLFESASINQGDINISDGRLIVGVDGTQVDSEGRVTGHALYSHDGTITTDATVGATTGTDIDENSVLIFRASGLGVDTVIAMTDENGNTTDISSLSNEQLGTMSLVHTANKRDDGDVQIDIMNWEEVIAPPEGGKPPEIKDSSDLGEIYESIKNGGEIGKLAPTTDLVDGRTDALPELVSLLDQIYANNPYSYGGLMSKYSSDMFREGVYSSSTIMPEGKEYITTGQALYSFDRYRTVEKNNNYGTESQKNSYSSYSNTAGLLGTIEYGIKADESLGFAIGGAKQKLYMDNDSDLKGDSVYLGVFYKKNVDKFKFTTGLGYQHNMYKADRDISNKYQSFDNEGEFNTNLFNAYGQMKYTLAEDKGWKVEPKLKLSYTYVDQNSVSEDSGDLAIDVNKTNYNYFDTEVGVDFVKEALIPKGKVRAIASVAYVNSQGTSEKELTGRMKNSTDFGIQGQTLNENNGKVGIGVELEKENGMTYSVGTDLTFSSEDQRNVNVRVGIGYKF